MEFVNLIENKGVNKEINSELLLNLIMRCVFCKSDSSDSRSIEHIIPESLGNKKQILPPGIVCDKCNQYFSLKIEKPVLEKPYFISVRHRNFIESKKRKIPLERAIISGDSNVFIDVNKGERSVVVDDSKTIDKIISGKVKQMWVPFFDSPSANDRDISRFLGKMAIEALAHKFYDTEDWLNEITDKPELEDLKQYVRIGNKPIFWEYNQRRIYNEEDRFENLLISNEPYEILHEFILLYTAKMEMYLVIAIMGIEYSINLTNPKIEGYTTWLEENNNNSPLFDPNERRIINLPFSFFNPGDNMNFVKNI